MLLGARQFFERRGTPAWQNPYVTDGLVAMWDGEWNAGGGVHDPNATTWVDLTGNGWNGAIGSSVVIEQNAMKFDGVRSLQSCCTVGKGWFGKPPHVTIECLIQPLGWNYRGENGSIAVFGSTEAGTGGFTLFANTIGFGACRLQLRDAVGLKYAAFPFSIAENNLEIWGASVTADGSSLSSYADGIQYSSIAMGDVVYTGAEDWNFYIGADYWGPVEFNFNGRIFSVRIYSRALTAAEIAANYAIDKARFNLP